MKKDKIRDVLIYSKIAEIEESIDLVEQNLPRSLEEFMGMGIVKDGIYKRLEYAIENVFDICHIINADLSLGIPSSDEDVIENLRLNKILDPDISGKLVSMRKFRNIVVHRYGKIDDKIAFLLMHGQMEDFPIFNEKIKVYLKNHGS